MRLKLLLPKVEPQVYQELKICPYPDCQGRHFHLWQSVTKPLRDTLLDEVMARRYDCLRCGRTFRVYPMGVCADQTSRRLKGLAVLLYLLGLSYGAVALALEALGHPLGKTAIYEAVQQAGERVPGLRRQGVAGKAALTLGADLTSVKCRGEWLTVGVSVDALEGTALTVDILENEESETLQAWVGDVAKLVGAEVLVSDDADSFKLAADDSGLGHQVCKAHVVRNTEAWVEAIGPQLEKDEDGSLARIGVRGEEALADLERLLARLRERETGPESERELATIHQRYLSAPSPRELGQKKASLAYRLRLFTLDRWNLWRRLTFYRHWQGEKGARLDGTNNACERAIGWWVKERYRSMRGYKRPQSVLNVSRLIAWAGNHLDSQGADLSLVVA